MLTATSTAALTMPDHSPSSTQPSTTANTPNFKPFYATAKYTDALLLIVPSQNTSTAPPPSQQSSNTPLKIHRLVLASQSKYFDTLFTKDPEEWVLDTPPQIASTTTTSAPSSLRWKDAENKYSSMDRIHEEDGGGADGPDELDELDDEDAVLSRRVSSSTSKSKFTVEEDSSRSLLRSATTEDFVDASEDATASPPNLAQQQRSSRPPLPSLPYSKQRQTRKTPTKPTPNLYKPLYTLPLPTFPSSPSSLEKETFAQVIEWVYTRSLPSLNLSTCFPVLRLATIFELPELKDQVFNFLEEIVRNPSEGDRREGGEWFQGFLGALEMEQDLEAEGKVGVYERLATAAFEQLLSNPTTTTTTITSNQPEEVEEEEEEEDEDMKMLKSELEMQESVGIPKSMKYRTWSKARANHHPLLNASLSKAFSAKNTAPDSSTAGNSNESRLRKYKSSPSLSNTNTTPVITIPAQKGTKAFQSFTLLRSLLSTYERQHGRVVEEKVVCRLLGVVKFAEFSLEELEVLQSDEGLPSKVVAGGLMEGVRRRERVASIILKEEKMVEEKVVEDEESLVEVGTQVGSPHVVEEQEEEEEVEDSLVEASFEQMDEQMQPLDISDLLPPQDERPLPLIKDETTPTFKSEPQQPESPASMHSLSIDALQAFELLQPKPLPAPTVPEILQPLQPTKSLKIGGSSVSKAGMPFFDLNNNNEEAVEEDEKMNDDGKGDVTVLFSPTDLADLKKEISSDKKLLKRKSGLRDLQGKEEKVEEEEVVEEVGGYVRKPPTPDLLKEVSRKLEMLVEVDRRASMEASKNASATAEMNSTINAGSVSNVDPLLERLQKVRSSVETTSTTVSALANSNREHQMRVKELRRVSMLEMGSLGEERQKEVAQAEEMPVPPPHGRGSNHPGLVSKQPPPQAQQHRALGRAEGQKVARKVASLPHFGLEQDQQHQHRQQLLVHEALHPAARMSNEQHQQQQQDWSFEYGASPPPPQRISQPRPVPPPTLRINTMPATAAAAAAAEGGLKDQESTIGKKGGTWTKVKKSIGKRSSGFFEMVLQGVKKKGEKV
ncbi:hypothetical protein HDV05_007117 [Chytridiales sp. JEL 0842]|nr:hypothetical protein HDV05_007117 [Chytridiales sp. JEL 0842]